KRLFNGITVDTDQIAFDVVKKVGPGGNFLTEDHTAMHFREVWAPTLIDRFGYASWEAAGKKDMTQRTVEKMRNILETHTPKALSDEAKAAIDAVLEKAEASVK
ncbi:MAG: trimethylamine methyltransferase family protein, partial [Clostridia bacterium]